MAIRPLLFTLISTFAFVSSAFAQVTFHWEPIVYHDYEPGDPLFVLDGHITWQLFAEFDLPDDNDAIPEYVLGIYGEDLPDQGLSPLTMNFDCACYQDPEGGATASSGNNISFLANLPGSTLLYDTYVTIGGQYVDDFATNLLVAEDPSFPWVQNFEQNCSLEIGVEGDIGGAWFVSPPYGPANFNGITDVDNNNRILIGQFTLPVGCNLEPDASLCIQYMVDPEGDDYSGYDTFIDCVEIDEANPCFANPIFPSVTNVDSVSCVGGADGLVEVNSILPSDEISISIDAVSFTDEGLGAFGGLEAGEYEITFTDLIIDDLDGNDCQSTITVLVEEPNESLAGTATVVTPVQCAGIAVGEVDIQVTGGTPFTVGEPYTVTTPTSTSVFTAPNTFSFAGLDASPGIQFTVLDSNNCETIVTQALGPDGALLASGEVTDVLCHSEENGTISLTITGGEPNPVITWTNDLGAPLTINDDINPTNLAPGNYFVNLNDGANCEVDLDFTINEPDTILLSGITTVDLDCFGVCTGEISLTVTGGTGDYEIDFIQNGAILESGNLCAGETQINVRDENNCLVTSNIQIGENSEMFFNALVNDIECPAGCDGVIDLSGRTGGVGDITPMITPLTIFDTPSSSYLNLCANTYDITISDELGCSKDTTIFMIAPPGFTTSTSFENITCNSEENGEITVEASGGTGEITYSLNSIISNITGEFIGLSPGNYSVSGEDESGCTFTLDEPITLEEPEEISIEDFTTTSPGCGGEATATAAAVIQGGTPDYLYSWNGNAPQSDPAVGGLAAGTNTLQISDQNSCLKDTTFQIDEPLPITIVINSQDVTCTGMCDGNFTVAAIAIEPYAIDFGNIDNSEVCEGEYPIVVTDGLGCIARDTVQIASIIVSDMEYTVFTTPVSCWEEADGTATIAVTGGLEPITYSWSDVNQNQTTATAVGLNEDFYTVTITDAQGCTFTDEFFIEPTIGCFFVAEAITPNGDGANDEWIIGGLEYFEEAKVEVFNRWGQQVFQSVGNYTPWDGQLNSNRLPVADYYYVITFDPNSPPLTGTVTIKY